MHLLPHKKKTFIKIWRGSKAGKVAIYKKEKLANEKWVKEEGDKIFIENMLKMERKIDSFIFKLSIYLLIFYFFARKMAVNIYFR